MCKRSRDSQKTIEKEEDITAILKGICIVTKQLVVLGNN